MSLPNIHVDINGTAIALYGAVLSTITGAVQVINHFRDRVSIKIKIRRHMKRVGLGSAYDNMTFTIISAINIGRRPTTITGFGAELLYKQGETETSWYLTDVRPQVPCEITEGKQASAFLNEDGVDFDLIKVWHVWDTTGRDFKKYVSPLHKRVVSKVRRFFASKRNKTS